MLSRTHRLFTVPAFAAAAFALATLPPQETAVPAPVVRAAMQLPARQKPVALPRIVAVDQRIAERVNELRPAVKRRLARVIARLPRRVVLLVTSASRTHEEQVALHSTFGVKARPGTSAHEDGRAVDLNVLVDGERISPRHNNDIIGDVMASEGFRYLGRRDPVHYSVPKDAADMNLASAPNLTVATVDQMHVIEAQNAQVLASEPLTLAGNTAIP
jgi:hypothetical protein